MTKKVDTAVITNSFILWLVSLSILALFLGFYMVLVSKDVSRESIVMDEFHLSVENIINKPPSKARTNYLIYANKIISQDTFNRLQWIRLGNMYDEVMEVDQEADYAKQKAKLIKQTANALKQ